VTISAADLLKLRSTPHQTKLYLIVQQPEIYDSDAGTWSGYVWSGTVSAAPGTTNDEISVNSANGTTLLDGMTVLIDSATTGGRNRGIFTVHGDQTIGAGAETLYIYNSGELGSVVNGDKIVALDEFRYIPRYPKVTESGGALTWYKSWGYFRDSLAADGYTWAQLANSEAVYPPTPVMGPHRVAFIDPDVGSVDVDFDWSNSYTLSPGGTLENPAAETYSNLSGLAGYRTTLSVLSDKADPIIEFRRGVRYVFTLRRPDQYQSGTDPTPEAHYTPITDFEVNSVSGDFATGSWSTSVRIFGSAAADYTIQPGALVILFAEDWYAGTKESLGPISGTENIVFVGHIADGAVVQDSETGDVTFDVISLAEQASRRENYPVPITNDDTPTEWTDAQDLTISRAAWWFTVWHSNLAQVTDVYADIQINGASDTREIAGQDFLAGDLFRASLDNFLQARVVGRVLMDRYERAAFVIDRQVQTAGGASTLFDLTAGDWIGQVQLREVYEVPANIVEAGGVNYNAGTITPYLSIAPGNVSGYIGTNQASNNLAVTGQAQLNTISGDLYAYANNKWPELVLQMAGNWRFGDLWPQEYIDVDLTLERYTLTNEDFLVRGVAFDYDPAQGTMFTTYRAEYETDGPDGVTVPILSELEPTTGNTETPPEKPPGFNGTAVVATNDDVWITTNLLDSSPNWTRAASGLNGIDALALVENPNVPGEYWAGGSSGLYYTTDLTGGTAWTQILSGADIASIATINFVEVTGIGFCAQLPDYAVVVGRDNSSNVWVIDNKSNGASTDTADWRGRGIGTDSMDGPQSLAVSQHTDAGGTEPRCVLIGVQQFGFLFIEDTQDTSGAWTENTVNVGGSSSEDAFPITFWDSTTYDDDTAVIMRQWDSSGGAASIRKSTTFLDAGVPVNTNVGDAGMDNSTGARAVCLWADIVNSYWYFAGTDDMWYTDDGGTTWENYGEAFPSEPQCADGDLTKGIVMASGTAGADIYYNGDNDDWDDKTGDLAVNRVYRIYLLDV